VKHTLKQSVEQLTDSQTGQGLAATFTTISGVGTVLNYLPALLGMAATMMGIMLTWVMINKGRLGAKKIKLEIALMKKQHKCSNCKGGG
jgi:hypothetical protein